MGPVRMEDSRRAMLLRRRSWLPGIYCRLWPDVKRIKCPELTVPADPANRRLDPTQRSLAAEDEEHVENSRARGDPGERDAQRLKDLSCADPAGFGHRAERLLRCRRCPLGDCFERVVCLLENVPGSGLVLPLLGDRVGVVLDCVTEIRRRLAHDVVDRA